MEMKSRAMWCVYWTVVVVAFAAVTVMLSLYTPIEQTMGPIQKIFYLHLPAANALPLDRQQVVLPRKRQAALLCVRHARSPWVAVRRAAAVTPR